MNGSGMSGVWVDAWDATLDAAHPILRQLAAEKLMREGVIPSANPPAIMQPSFYAGSPTVSAQVTPAPTSQTTVNGTNLGIMAVVLVVVLILLREMKL